ncbi:MAG TPA: hypothetical protein GX513_09150 [Firmicutes bacterium]|nr:hypothetical protein [Bacillota bacterium]
MMFPRWYVLDVERGREREVEAALDDAYITCLLPCLFFGPARPSKREEEGSAELLFPGCMFVRLAPADHGWEVVAGLPAVRGVVGFGGDPVPVPDDLPDSLIRLSLGSGCLVYRGGRLKDYGAERLGDELSGFLSRPPDGDGRVRCLLDLVARESGGWGTGKTLKVLAVGSAFRRNQG